MKRTLVVATSLALAITLTACQKKSEAPPPAPGGPMMSGNMANMPMAGAMKHGMAAGTVTAIDATKGTITLDHGPMSGLGWTAMTMSFTVKPEQLSGIKVGDKVDFEVDWDGKTAMVSKIEKTAP